MKLVSLIVFKEKTKFQIYSIQQVLIKLNLTLLWPKQVLLVFMIVARATGYEIDHCMGCLDSLFQTKATPLSGDKKLPVQVLTSDAGKLVAAHIDEMKFKDVLKETIPSTSNLTELYSTPDLDCK